MNNMYGLVFEINFEFQTNISIVIVDAHSWHKDIMNTPGDSLASLERRVSILRGAGEPRRVVQIRDG